jgi:nanoRNase/pAp phosphatase (c-di-AMP/oligoRNAs hydrolase)
MNENENNNAQRVRELIENARTIAVVPSKVAGADAFSAGVGLYYMLAATGKDASLVYTGKVPEVAEHLIKKEEISSNIFTRELLVSIDYSNTPAAKVHYSTENDVLTLKLSPVPKDFDKGRVKSYIKGMEFDVIITIGVQDLTDLGQTYRELEEEFRSAKIVNVDNTDRNRKFGIVNIIDTTASNLSMVLYRKASEWGLTPDDSSAKALLTGMTYREVKVDSQ